MSITTRTVARQGNALLVHGTLTCTATGEAQAVVDTNGRLLTFQAFNSDGQESPEITLNSNDGTEETAMGSAYKVHGGSNGDVWNYVATYI